MPKIHPPFQWLNRYGNWLSVSALLVIAAVFRLFELASLPPGLYSGEAAVGLDALNLANHGVLPGLTAANQYAPLWVWLQAIPVKLLGHTALALRLWPALLGIVAVWLTWLWARDWFDRRIAWIAAFLVAVTPWAVTLTRNALPVALILCLVPLTLWVATWAYHRATLGWYLGLAAVLLADVLAGPLGWLLAAATIVLAMVRLIQGKALLVWTQARLGGLIGLLVVLAVGVASIALSWGQLRHLPAAEGLTAKLTALSNGLVGTLTMFNLHGDENFRHNFAGQPLLNAFVGLMLIAGLLVSISRLSQRRYRVLLILTGVLLLPAILSTIDVPNAAHAAAALPLVMVLAAVGVSYMLELWYATFPINSAARSTGQAVIILLLALTAFQGYAQYFRAWAGSSETYAAYNEGAVGAAGFLKSDHSKGQRYLVATADELQIPAYLDAGISYVPLKPGQVAGVPINQGTPKLFIITAAARDEAARNLSLKFPGGKLRPYLSSFNNSEIYYAYEVAQ